MRDQHWKIYLETKIASTWRQIFSISGEKSFGHRNLIFRGKNDWGTWFIMLKRTDSDRFDMHKNGTICALGKFTMCTNSTQKIPEAKILELKTKNKFFVN